MAALRAGVFRVTGSAVRHGGTRHASSAAPLQDSALFCRELVRFQRMVSLILAFISRDWAQCELLELWRHDFENFLATLLLPPVSQDGAMAVRAFNVSAALVADQVTQKAVGQMRIKFWDDAIDSVYSGSPPAQPVAVQLHKAVQRHKLSKRWLRRVLSSREDGLSEKAFPTMAALDTYSENSVSSVLYLTLECLGFRDVHADHAASHIGRAQGAVTLLRAIPHNASRRRVLVPLELLAKHKVSQQDIVRGSCSTNIKDLIFDIAGSANAHLEKAASMRHQVPSAARVALLPEVCVLSYLQRLRKADFNVFDGGLQQRHQLLPASLLWAKFRHRFPG